MLGIENIGANVVDGFFGEQKANKAMQREKEMANFYHDLSMKKWRQTGVRAQANEMRRAGLNVGLMHGNTAGAQGQTTVTPGGDQKAPNSMQSNSNFLDVAMMKAQIDNLREDTRARRIENNREEEIGDKRKRTVEDLEWKRADAELQQIFNSYDFEKGGLSRGEEMELWKYEVKEVEKEIAKRENRVQDETERERIEKIKYDYFNSIVDKKLKEAKIDLTREQERKLWHDIWQGWTKAGLQGLDMIIKGRLKDIGKGFNEKPRQR